MSFLGLGGSYGSSHSQSNSLGIGVNQSASRSLSGGQSTTEQQIAFAPQFAALYGNAGSAAANAADMVPGLQGQAGMLFSGGLDFLSQLHDIGSEDNTQAQLDALKSSVGDFYNETLLPGVVNEGVGSGNLGGGRDAVATAMAAKTAGGQFSQGAAQIIGNAANQRIAANTAGLNALPSVYGIASQGAQAGLAPYLALAQILGGPTTLTSSQSTNFAKAISDSLGLSYDTSQSSGSSHNTSFNIGI